MADGQPGIDGTHDGDREAQNASPAAGISAAVVPAKGNNRLVVTTVSAAVLSLVMIGSLAFSGKAPLVFPQTDEQAVTAAPEPESDRKVALASPDLVEEESAKSEASTSEANRTETAKAETTTPETAKSDTAKAEGAETAQIAPGVQPGSPEQWQSAHIEPVPPAEAAPAAELPAAIAQHDTPPAAEASEPAPALRNVPLPMPRPPEFRRQSAQAAARRPDRQRQQVAAAAPAPIEDTRSFFDKLLGLPPSSPPALSYAALETRPTLTPVPKPLAPMAAPVPALPASIPAPATASTPRATTAMIDTKPALVPLPKPLNTPPVPTPRAGGGTAVYDITAKTVTMPNGERLEAHSGIGDTMDDPRYVYVSMRGATPPGTYDLTERERPFHGVRALRMHPVGGSAAVHGRVGLLTHSYLRGPSGASSGCVSFRDYNRFLQAYLRGEVTRIVVVPGSGGVPENPISSFVNKLFGGA